MNENKISQYDNYQCLCPSRGKHELKKDQFHYELEWHYGNIPANDIKIIVGDLKAHIGKEDADQSTLEFTDYTRKLMIMVNDLQILQQVKTWPLAQHFSPTRISPNGMTSYQIDHILIERRWATNIMNIRSYRGACCVFVHFLVKEIYNSVWCDVFLTVHHDINLF
jgi:hypothetical protein